MNSMPLTSSRRRMSRPRRYRFFHDHLLLWRPPLKVHKHLRTHRLFFVAPGGHEPGCRRLRKGQLDLQQRLVAALYFERELVVSVAGKLGKRQRLLGLEHEDGTPIERLRIVPPDELDAVDVVTPADVPPRLLSTISYSPSGAPPCSRSKM